MQLALKTIQAPMQTTASTTKYKNCGDCGFRRLVINSMIQRTIAASNSQLIIRMLAAVVPP